MRTLHTKGLTLKMKGGSILLSRGGAGGHRLTKANKSIKILQAKV